MERYIKQQVENFYELNELEGLSSDVLDDIAIEIMEDTDFNNELDQFLNHKISLIVSKIES